METPKHHSITAIVAANEKRAIGKNGELMYKIPGDLPRFKEITTGHPIIMGFGTFQSMGEKLLPNRTTIVLNNDTDFKLEGALVAHSKEEALELAKKSDGSEEIFIVGGGQVYELLLPDTDTIDMTLVHDDADGDTFFPEHPEFTEIISKETFEENGINFTRLTLERPQNKNEA